MTDEQIEQEIQAKGADKAPRVTLADIEGAIQETLYFTAADGVHGTHEVPGNPDGWRVPDSLKLLTFCVLILRNGFTLVGKSACVSAENFNADIGRKVAREDAINQAWPLFGFHLASMLNGPLFQVPPAPPVDSQE